LSSARKKSTPVLEAPPDPATHVRVRYLIQQLLAACDRCTILSSKTRRLKATFSFGSSAQQLKKATLIQQCDCNQHHLIPDEEPCDASKGRHQLKHQPRCAGGHVEKPPDARMSLDPLAPVAPARVKILLLPLGQIKADRFASFVERLNREHVVHLRDISADGRPNRSKGCSRLLKMALT
jgi:hypothetical protein